MWRYVGHLKDSLEQTCSHLKNLRSTICTSNGPLHENRRKDSYRRIEVTQDGRNFVWRCLGDPYEPSNDQKPNCKPSKQKNTFDIDTPYVIQRCYQKQKQKQQHAFTGPVDINILQWTAGILCSLYFGKMMCFYSRQRQNLKRWHHMEQMLCERTLRQTLEKFDRHYKVHQKSFVPSNDQNHWIDSSHIHGIRGLKALMPVANDHFQPNNTQNNTFTSATQTATQGTKFSEAVDDLILTLGSIEFNLGMQNLRANEPEVAVSHLKLATTHRHPEATVNLGICYELGLGVQKNLKNAMECYRSAAALGNKKAMYNLGIFYIHGYGGLKKNRDAARACFEAADKKGFKKATKALSLPEKPIKVDEEVQWKSQNLIFDSLDATLHRRQSSAI